MHSPPDKPICCDLSGDALIRVAGADARSFLQGQLSNDVRQVSPAQSQLTSLNTPQGRTLALMRLFEYRDALYLSLPNELGAMIVERLRRFVLRSRVGIALCTGEPAQLGIAGADSEAILAGAGLEPPPTVDGMYTGGDAAVIRLRSHHGDRFELIGDPQRLVGIASHCQPTGAAEWRLLDTLAGIPLLGTATSGEFLPQMLNLDELGAISYKKGCYPGQEIIARTHYRGQVKRRLRLLFSNSAVAPGTALNAGDKEASGTVLQSALRPAQGAALLAVVPIDWNDGDRIHLAAAGGEEARLGASDDAQTADSAPG